MAVPVQQGRLIGFNPDVIHTDEKIIQNVWWCGSELTSTGCCCAKQESPNSREIASKSLGMLALL